MDMTSGHYLQTSLLTPHTQPRDDTTSAEQPPPPTTPPSSQKSTMGGHHYNPEAEPKKDQNLQAIKDARTPLAWRDTCSHILVDLNKCRRETWWNPNKCEHARHVYEECEYNAYLQRIEAKVQLDKLNAQE
jgi:hypothetical protein